MYLFFKTDVISDEMTDTTRIITVPWAHVLVLVTVVMIVAMVVCMRIQR